MHLGKVGVLCGGTSSEREVSLMSGKAVEAALLAEGVDAHHFDFLGEKTVADLMAAGFDRVINVMHGGMGEDGTLQGFLDVLQLPYTGCGVAASSLAMNKIMSKDVWVAHGIPTPAYRRIRDFAALEVAVSELDFPLMLKVPSQGSSLGLEKVSDLGALKDAYDRLSAFGEDLLAERFIRGRELTVLVMGEGAESQAYPIVEIQSPGGNYDYQNKYFSDDTQYHCPADLESSLTQAIQDTCVRAYRALGARGWARIDVLLSTDGAFYLLEMNTVPGMTGHSLAPMAAKAAGISYGQLCVRLLEGARYDHAVAQHSPSVAANMTDMAPQEASEHASGG